MNEPCVYCDSPPAVEQRLVEFMFCSGLINTVTCRGACVTFDVDVGEPRAFEKWNEYQRGIKSREDWNR